MKKKKIAIIAAAVIVGLGIGIFAFLSSRVSFSFNDKLPKNVPVNTMIDMAEYIDNPNEEILTLKAEYEDEGEKKEYNVAGLAFKPKHVGKVEVTVSSVDTSKSISATIDVIEAAPTFVSADEATFFVNQTIQLASLIDYVIYESDSEPDFHVTQVEYGENVVELTGETEYTFPEIQEYIFYFELENTSGKASGMLIARVTKELTELEEDDLTNNIRFAKGSHATIDISEDEHDANSDWGWKVTASPLATFGSDGYARNDVYIDFGREIDTAKEYYTMRIKVSEDCQGVGIQYLDAGGERHDVSDVYQSQIPKGEWFTISGEDFHDVGYYTGIYIRVYHPNDGQPYNTQNVNVIVDNCYLHEYVNRDAKVYVSGVLDATKAISGNRITLNSRWYEMLEAGSRRSAVAHFSGAYKNEALEFTTTFTNVYAPNLVVGLRMNKAISDFARNTGLRVVFNGNEEAKAQSIAIYGPGYSSEEHIASLSGYQLENGKQYTFTMSVETKKTTNLFVKIVETESGKVLLNSAVPINKAISSSGEFAIWSRDKSRTLTYVAPRVVERKDMANTVVDANGKAGSAQLVSTISDEMGMASYLNMKGNYKEEYFEFTTVIKDKWNPNLVLGARLGEVSEDIKKANGVIAVVNANENENHQYIAIYAPNYSGTTHVDSVGFSIAKQLASGKSYTFIVRVLNKGQSLSALHITIKDAKTNAVMLDYISKEFTGVSANGSFAVWNLDETRQIDYKMPKNETVIARPDITITGPEEDSVRPGGVQDRTSENVGAIVWVKTDVLFGDEYSIDNMTSFLASDGTNKVPMLVNGKQKAYQVQTTAKGFLVRWEDYTVPKQGDTFQIPKGTVLIAGNYDARIRATITADYTLEYDGTTWIWKEAPVPEELENINVTIEEPYVAANTDADGLEDKGNNTKYLWLRMKDFSFGDSFSCAGVPFLDGTLTVKVNDNETQMQVRANNTLMVIVWDNYATPVNGSTLVIPAGSLLKYTDKDTNKLHVFTITEEFKYIYNGTEWKVYEPKIPTTPFTITGLNIANTKNADGQNLYFAVDTDAASVVDSDATDVELSGEAILRGDNAATLHAYAKLWKNGMLRIGMRDVLTLGTTYTIPAGFRFTVGGVTYQLTNTFVFECTDATAPGVFVDPNAPVIVPTDISLDSVSTVETNDRYYIWFKLADGYQLPSDVITGSPFTDNRITIADGVTCRVRANAANGNLIAVCVSESQAITPAVGDIYTIAEGTVLQFGDNHYNISQQFQIQWNGTEWKDTSSVDFSITGPDTSTHTDCGVQDRRSENVGAIVWVKTNLHFANDYGIANNTYLQDVNGSQYITVMVDGSPKNYAIQTNGAGLYVRWLDYAPVKGSTFVIPAGTSLVAGDYKFNLTEAYCLIFDGTNWMTGTELPQEGAIEVSISGGKAMSGTTDNYGFQQKDGSQYYLWAALGDTSINLADSLGLVANGYADNINVIIDGVSTSCQVRVNTYYFAIVLNDFATKYTAAGTNITIPKGTEIKKTGSDTVYELSENFTYHNASGSAWEKLAAQEMAVASVHSTGNYYIQLRKSVSDWPTDANIFFHKVRVYVNDEAMDLEVRTLKDKAVFRLLFDSTTFPTIEEGLEIRIPAGTSLIPSNTDGYKTAYPAPYVITEEFVSYYDGSGWVVGTQQ